MSKSIGDSVKLRLRKRKLETVPAPVWVNVEGSPVSRTYNSNDFEKSSSLITVKPLDSNVVGKKLTSLPVR